MYVTYGERALDRDYDPSIWEWYEEYIAECEEDNYLDWEDQEEDELFPY